MLSTPKSFLYYLHFKALATKISHLLSYTMTTSAVKLEYYTLPSLAGEALFSEVTHVRPI